MRTQLGSILRKVGAERQSDLIRILSGTGIGSVSLAAGWFDIAVTVAQLPLSLAAIIEVTSQRGRAVDPKIAVMA